MSQPQPPETKPVAKAPPQKELPQFEKSIADKIESKFSSKATIEFVKVNRIRVKVKKKTCLTWQDSSGTSFTLITQNL